MPAIRETQIFWDVGTAYDFFASYVVLKDPKMFGVRSSWASGMRARLQPEDRETLDSSLVIVKSASRWIHSLPQPKDAEHCLAALARVPARDRLATISCCPQEIADCTPEQQLLRHVSENAAWDESDLSKLKAHRTPKKKLNHAGPSSEDLITTLDAWAESESYGEEYLRALRAYYEVFYREEERRIAPKLEKALQHAKERAKQLSSVDLIEEISQGIRYDESPTFEKLTLVPSYWISPFVKLGRLDPSHAIWEFGARPANDSLVPGDPIPDALRMSMKALAEPTRLRILRYLNQEPLPLAELAKRLRLRLPTVIHHISALRMAGMVMIHVQPTEKGHRSLYSVRKEGLDETLRSLRGFLESGPDS